MAGNQAVSVNAPTTVEHITSHGSDWLWAVFGIMLFSDIIVFAWSYTLPRGQRVFHHLSMIILSTAAIAYFTMAADLGYASIPTEFAYDGFPAGVTRQIWYTRYIDWVITTPSLLLTLVLASGLPLSDIITLAFFDLVMIITGLIGALVQTSYKWGFFTFGCVALFYIWWVLAGPARASALALGPAYQRTFTTSAGILSFLWLLYPVAWGLADGAAVISSDSEMVFYGILDVLAKPVFCFVHLFMLSKLDLTVLQLSSGKYTTSANGPTYDAEKTRHNGIRDNGIHDNSIREAVIGAGVVPSANNQSGGKRGFTTKRGRYDATGAPAGNTTDGPVVEPPINGRTSNATAVNA